MKRYGLLALLLMLSGILGCSDSSQNSTEKQASSGTTAKPASVNNTAPKPQNGLPLGGTVIKVLHAKGYTYMKVKLNNSDKEVWAAATMMNVKREQKVKWVDAALMRHFTSQTLRRTFDEILFVSHASIDQ